MTRRISLIWIHTNYSSYYTIVELEYDNYISR